MHFRGRGRPCRSCLRVAISFVPAGWPSQRTMLTVCVSSRAASAMAMMRSTTMEGSRRRSTLPFKNTMRSLVREGLADGEGVGQDDAFDDAGFVFDGDHGHLGAGGPAVLDDGRADAGEHAADDDGGFGGEGAEVGDGDGGVAVEGVAVFVEGMAGDVEAQNALFMGEHLMVGPRRNPLELPAPAPGSSPAPGSVPAPGRVPLLAGLVGLAAGGRGRSSSWRAWSRRR